VKMGLKGKIFKFMSDKKTGLIISYTHRRNLPQPVACQRDFFNFLNPKTRVFNTFNLRFSLIIWNYHGIHLLVGIGMYLQLTGYILANFHKL